MRIRHGTGKEARVTPSPTEECPPFKKPLKKVISINGEEVNDIGNMNIHDNIIFEREQHLADKFLNKIRRTSEGEGHTIVKKKSFGDLARDVVRAEMVLRAFRHYNHRSDTEDSDTSDEECPNSKLNTKKSWPKTLDILNLNPVKKTPAQTFQKDSSKVTFSDSDSVSDSLVPSGSENVSENPDSEQIKESEKVIDSEPIRETVKESKTDNESVVDTDKIYLEENANDPSKLPAEKAVVSQSDNNNTSLDCRMLNDLDVVNDSHVSVSGPSSPERADVAVPLIHQGTNTQDAKLQASPNRRMCPCSCTVL